MRWHRHLDPELERRLSAGLGRLAERATFSADAWQRIRRASDEDDQRVVPLVPAARGHQGRRRWTVVVPAAAAVAVAAALVALVGPGRSSPPPRQAAAGGGAAAAGGAAARGGATAGGAASPRGASAATKPGSSSEGSTSTSTSTSSSGFGGRPTTTRAAWVAGGILHLESLTGTAATTAVVPVAGSVDNVEWSADGQWVAYLVKVSSSLSQLRVARWDGRRDHAVASGAGFYAFLWSPAADVLATEPYQQGGQGGVVVVGLDGSRRQVVAASTSVNSFVWSPDGRYLAFAGPGSPIGTGQVTHVYTVPAGGGTPTRLAYDPPPGDTVVLGGWWPDDRGLLLWPDPAGSASIEADGLSLTAVPLRGGHPQVLARTLVYLPWLAWSPDGSRLLVVAGGDRFPVSARHLELCRPPAGPGSWSCRGLAQPSGTLTLDPAWAPDGRHMAFVRARASSVDGGSGVSLAASYQSRRLYVAGSDGSDPHLVEVRGPSRAAAPQAAAGVTLPVWSVDGTSIGYSTGSAVLVVPAAGGRARVLADGLTGPTAGRVGPDAMGKAPWQGVAVWDTGPATAASGGT